MPQKSERTISPRAARAWQRLQEWYGARFSEQFGAVPPPDWSAAIDNASNDLVKRALSILRAECVEFPPTFPQFAKALRPPRLPSRGELTPQDRLCMFAARRYHRRLTEKQFIGPWTYLYRDVIAFNETGKEVAGAQCIGVVIPADGESPGHRINIEDMETLEATA